MDYSQFGEEHAILAACEQVEVEVGGNRSLLDIGAFHATDKSNTRALIERGWSGLLIEPSPGPLRGLVAEYGTSDRIKVLSAAVGLYPGIINLHISDDAVSTSDEGNFEVWKERGGFVGKLLVPVVTLEQISNQFGGFGFINIDAEGQSVDIFLRMMTLGWEPRCICVEHDTRTTEVLTAATLRGYHATFANGTNVVLVRG